MPTEDFGDEVRLEYYRAGVQVTREIGIMALRTIITLNSGAFVVLLTFIGNTAAQSRFAVPLWNLRTSMYLFLAGIALAFAAMAYTYVVSQHTSPYPSPQKKTDGWFVPIVVIISALAFLAFLIGVIVIVSGVGPAP